MTDLKNLYDAIIKGNLELSVSTTKSALAEGVDPQLIIKTPLMRFTNGT